MSILKTYIKMHSTSFFVFSHLKKYETCHCDLLRVLSKDLACESQIFFQSPLTIH